MKPNPVPNPEEELEWTTEEIIQPLKTMMKDSEIRSTAYTCLEEACIRLAAQEEEIKQLKSEK